MNIGEVSKLLGIPASTIRYYERVGLLERQPRVSGRRWFGRSALAALKFIQLAQAAGFTLAEMKELRDDYARSPDPSGLWRSVAVEKRQSVRAQIRHLSQMDEILSALLECKCATLSRCVERFCEFNQAHESGGA